MVFMMRWILDLKKDCFSWGDFRLIFVRNRRRRDWTLPLIQQMQGTLHAEAVLEETNEGLANNQFG